MVSVPGSKLAPQPLQPTREHPSRHGPDHQPTASRASRHQGLRRRAARSGPRSVILQQRRVSRECGQESPQVTHNPVPDRPMTTRQPAGRRPILVLPEKPARRTAKAPTWSPRARQPDHLSGPALQRTPKSAARRTLEILPPRRTGATSFSPTLAGHGSPSQASSVTHLHPFRPNARRHAQVSSQTHDPDDLHHLMKDGRSHD
jgi:hypothetical protein